MITFEPIGDYLIVRKLTDNMPGMSGSIIIPETAKRQATAGEVVAAGPGEPLTGDFGRKPMQIKVGDVVHYLGFAGVEVHDSLGKDLIAIKQDECVFIVRKSEDGGA